MTNKPQTETWWTMTRGKTTDWWPSMLLMELVRGWILPLCTEWGLIIITQVLTDWSLFSNYCKSFLIRFHLFLGVCLPKTPKSNNTNNNNNNVICIDESGDLFHECCWLLLCRAAVFVVVIFYYWRWGSVVSCRSSRSELFRIAVASEFLIRNVANRPHLSLSLCVFLRTE